VFCRKQGTLLVCFQQCAEKELQHDGEGEEKKKENGGFGGTKKNIK
jgi:hypothetical protein